METEGCLTLAEVVFKALGDDGLRVLNDPRVLLAYVMDYMDPNSPALRVLMRNLIRVRKLTRGTDGNVSRMCSI